MSHFKASVISKLKFSKKFQKFYFEKFKFCLFSWIFMYLNDCEGLLDDKWSFRIFKWSSFSSIWAVWFLSTNWIWIGGITYDHSARELVLVNWWCAIEFKCSVTDSDFGCRIFRCQIACRCDWIRAFVLNDVVINIVISSKMMNFTIWNSKDKSRWETD